MKNILIIALVVTLLTSCSAGTAGDGRSLASDYYRLLLEGDAEHILAAFGDAEPNIDTPRSGAVSGTDNVRRFLAEEQDWLNGLAYEPGSLETVRVTQSAERVVAEQTFVLGETAPNSTHQVSVVVELSGSTARAIRVYYSLNRVTGKHDFTRAAFMDYDPTLFDTLSPAMKQYFASIENAYTDVTRMFTSEGCFGPYCGDSKRARAFVVLMHGGSVPLRLTSVTCDSTACATEWNLASWGETEFSVNAGGMSVFEFDNEGRIVRGLAYDDLHEAPFDQPGWFGRNWSALSRKFDRIGCPMSFELDETAPGAEAWKMIMEQTCATSGD